MEFELKLVVEGIVRSPYGGVGGSTIEHVMHENSVAARGWCDGGGVLPSDECLTAETREGRFYFWNYSIPPFFFFVPFHASHTKTTRKYVTFGCLRLARGCEYIYCNTLHVPSTARLPVHRQGHRTDKSVQRRSRPDVSRKKQIRNVFCLFSDSRNGRVEQSMIADISRVAAGSKTQTS